MKVYARTVGKQKNHQMTEEFEIHRDTNAQNDRKAKQTTTAIFYMYYIANFQ